MCTILLYRSTAKGVTIKLTPVSDLDIPELRIYKTLRDRQTTRDESFIADSPKVVNMLLENGIKPRSILATKEYYDLNRDFLESLHIPTCYVAPRELMERIVGHRLHHNVMMHGKRPPNQDIGTLGKRIIMLDELSKSENIGAIARSAAALGIGSMVAPSYGPHPYGRRALRVSMGHISKLKLHIYANLHDTLAKLKKQGYRIIAAEVIPEATPLSKLSVDDKWVLLMGHEERGIPKETLEYCDETVRIEMEPEIKSFNVAIAASIILYQLKISL